MGGNQNYYQNFTRRIIIIFRLNCVSSHLEYSQVLWTELPCSNFHLLISVAILEKERDVLIQNDYGFTEILKVREVCTLLSCLVLYVLGFI